MLEFEKYSKIKDSYCICYFGHNDEYLLQIKILKPIIENKYKNLKIFIGCRDDKIDLFEDKNNLLKMSDLRSKRFDFGHIRELKFNGTDHPVESLMKECEIENYSLVNDLQEFHTNKCVIITKANYPTLNIDQNKCNLLKKTAIEEGYDVCFDENIKNAGLVMGVESYFLFEAASKGIRTLLYPTGVGTNLYKKMFPKAEVVEI